MMISNHREKLEIHKMIVSICVLLPFLIEVISTQFNFKYNVQTIVFVYLFSAFYLIFKNKFMISRISIKLLFFWLLLILVSIISALLSDNIILSMQRIFIILVSSFLLIIIVSSDKHKEMTFQTILRSFSLMALAFTLIAILISSFGYSSIYDNWRIEKLDIGPISIYQRLAGVDSIGVSSLFFNPNNFAAFLLIGLISSITIFHQNRANRKINLLIIIIIYIGLVMSMSRIAIALSVLIPFIFKFNKMRQTVNKILLVNVGLIILFFITINSVDKLMLIDLTGREIIWPKLFLAIKENLIFGIGFGLSYEMILEQLGLKGAHNVYLLVLSEIGIVGFFLFMIVNIKAIQNYIKSINCTVNDNMLSGALTFMIMLLGYEFFEGGLMGFSGLNFFWTYIFTYSYFSYSPTMTNNSVKEVMIK